MFENVHACGWRKVIYSFITVYFLTPELISDRITANCHPVVSVKRAHQQNCAAAEAAAPSVGLATQLAQEAL